MLWTLIVLANKLLQMPSMLLSCPMFLHYLFREGAYFACLTPKLVLSILMLLIVLLFVDCIICILFQVICICNVVAWTWWLVSSQDSTSEMDLGFFGKIPTLEFSPLEAASLLLCFFPSQCIFRPASLVALTYKVHKSTPWHFSLEHWSMKAC